MDGNSTIPSESVLYEKSGRSAVWSDDCGLGAAAGRDDGRRAGPRHREAGRICLSLSKERFPSGPSAGSSRHVHRRVDVRLRLTPSTDDSRKRSLCVDANLSRLTRSASILYKLSNFATISSLRIPDHRAQRQLQSLHRGGAEPVVRRLSIMDVEVDFGADEEAQETSTQTEVVDPEEYLSQNAFRVVYQTNNFFLPQIRQMIEKGEAINLRPEYQRRLRWTTVQKSKLIESLLLNIPVPPVFFYEADAARYEVMDGQQRMNTIREFFSGDFRLRGLTVLEPLNGLKYSICPPRIKRTLDRASISAIVLLLESEAERPGEGRLSLTDIRRLVFDRLNTGGMKLNPQEIRNALNPGRFNTAIIKLSRYRQFTDVFGIPPYVEEHEREFYENPQRQKNSLYASMRDCELVLRFFALKDEENIRGSMRSMLDRAIQAKLSETQASLCEEEFKRVFDFLYELFDGSPFEIKAEDGGRPKISAALYDAMMVAGADLINETDVSSIDKNEVRERLDAALNDPDKYEIIVGRRNTAEAVKERIQLMKRILRPD